MKTNIPLELTDAQRDRLANLIDGKQTKRLATRAEITDTARRAMMMIIEPRAMTTMPASAGDFPEFDDYLLETCGAVFGQSTGAPHELERY